MKKSILLIAAAAVAMTACQKEIELPQEEKATVETLTQWTLTVNAEKPGDSGTKSLELEGNKTLHAYWKAGETVNVFKGPDYIGSLDITPAGDERPVKATLSGTLTLTAVSVGDELTLLFPGRNDRLWTYIGQNGLLAGEGSIETDFDYAGATITVTGKDESAGKLTTGTASFETLQSIYRFGFWHGGSPVPVKTLTLSSAIGQIAADCDPATGTAATGELTIKRPDADTELVYVAIRNGNKTDDDTFSFTVFDADGATYKGSKTIPAAALDKGFVSAKSIAMQRLDLPKSTKGVSNVL